MTGLPNPGNRIDPLMMLNGRPSGWTKLYPRRNLVRNDAVVAYCFGSTAPFEWAETAWDSPARLGVRARASLLRRRPGADSAFHRRQFTG